jgi:hypothetical protein
LGKAARIKTARTEGADRRNTLVTKQTNPFRMNNPANAAKAIRLATGK